MDYAAFSPTPGSCQEGRLIVSPSFWFPSVFCVTIDGRRIEVTAGHTSRMLHLLKIYPGVHGRTEREETPGLEIFVQVVTERHLQDSLDLLLHVGFQAQLAALLPRWSSAAAAGL